jgi:hypothetical protein
VHIIESRWDIQFLRNSGRPRFLIQHQYLGAIHFQVVGHDRVKFPIDIFENFQLRFGPFNLTLISPFSLTSFQFRHNLIHQISIATASRGYDAS